MARQFSQAAQADRAYATMMAVETATCVEDMRTPARYGKMPELWGAPPGVVFHAVYGLVTYKHVDAYPRTEEGEPYWAETFTRDGQIVIEVYNWAFDAENFTFHNPVHELGHAFAHRTGGPDGYPRKPYDDLGRVGFGVYNPPGAWNQNSADTNSENFADMFLSWAYYPDSPMDSERYHWMEANMPYWMALAVTRNQ